MLEFYSRVDLDEQERHQRSIQLSMWSDGGGVVYFQRRFSKVRAVEGVDDSSLQHNDPQSVFLEGVANLVAKFYEAEEVVLVVKNLLKLKLKFDVEVDIYRRRLLLFCL